jgi:8-oxo-dGTP pyrophosphatase MutT (NUDIX family)
MSRAKSKWLGVSVIIRNAAGDYLLHQRSDGANCDSGKWGAPGGVVERGKTYLEAAALEVQQEAMCLLDKAEVRGVYDLDEWMVVVVRGWIIGTPTQPNSEIHKAGPWHWVSSARVEQLRNSKQLQDGLMRYFSGDRGMLP